MDEKNHSLHPADGIGYQGETGFIGLRYQHGLQNNLRTGNLKAYNRAVELIWELNLGSLFRDKRK